MNFFSLIYKKALFFNAASLLFVTQIQIAEGGSVTKGQIAVMMESLKMQLMLKWAAAVS